MTEEEFLPTAETTAFGNIDFPMIRLGEIYLIYAEACLRSGDIEAAMPYLEELSSRAGTVPPSVSDVGNGHWLMEERARELMWEGHRRTDLIRYGLFNTDVYLWPYKGGDSYTGQAFPAYKCLFSIPPTELATNLGLIQNPGYAVP